MIGYFLSYLDSALRLCCSGIVDDMDGTDRRKEQDIQKKKKKKKILRSVVKGGGWFGPD
jgi:hypothetical protein